MLPLPNDVITSVSVGIWYNLLRSLHIQLKCVIIYEFAHFNTLHFYENLISKTVHFKDQDNNLLKKNDCSRYVDFHLILYFSKHLTYIDAVCIKSYAVLMFITQKMLDFKISFLFAQQHLYLSSPV
jgi:hypothetical protein